MKYSIGCYKDGGAAPCVIVVNIKHFCETGLFDREKIGGKQQRICH